MRSRALLLLVAGLAVLTPTVAGADEDDFESGPSTFGATATAEGFRFHFGAPGFLVVERYVDFGAPVAQASIDNLGASKAFASDPYPGETFIAGPGTVSGVTGLPNPGNYPFFVASSYPATPEASLTQPGYALTAKSDEFNSAATAEHGGSQDASAILWAQATSAVNYDPDAGALLAESAAKATGIDIGGVLRIGAVSATAKASQSAGGTPTRESTFSLDAVSIAGQAVSISPAGLGSPGGGAPLPDGSPLWEALRQANISVQYLHAIDEPGGVISPGLLINFKFGFPGGPEHVGTLVLGRATARVAVG